MRKLLDCQLSIVRWGEKARYKRAKIGLLRKESTVYLAIFSTTNEKYPIESSNIQLMPAAIRLRKLGKDIFIKQPSDDLRYETIMREIKVLLNRDHINRGPKAERMKNFISNIPTFNSFDPKDLVPWSRTSLHELTLTNCNLKHFPKQLESLSGSLISLDLSHNDIEIVPRAFCCKMNSLKKFNLSHNKIEILPIEIKFFRRLVDLNLSNNNLRMLPSTFSDLKRLRFLNVANNQLSQLPAFRKEEVCLQELDVSYNPFDGASNEANLFEVYPSYDDDNQMGYQENLVKSPSTLMLERNTKCPPSLCTIALLRVVRCDSLLKLASQEALPETIVSTMQREIFKCYRCSQLNMLPAYNSTDILDYVEQVTSLISTGNYRHGMTFMKLLCRGCFDSMSSTFG